MPGVSTVLDGLDQAAGERLDRLVAAHHRRRLTRLGWARALSPSGVLLVLPARPTSGADTTRGQLGALLEADRGADRLLATTLTAQQGGVSRPLYVHAKIGIVDDRWLTIGSANLNEHSLFNDTELNVITLRPWAGPRYPAAVVV